MTAPNPEIQSDWKGITDASDLTPAGVCDEYGLNIKSLSNWLKGDVVPREINRQKVVKIMFELIDKKKLEKHPSYGYATPEQIKELGEIGVGPRRTFLLKQIEKQNKLQGKRK